MSPSQNERTFGAGVLENEQRGTIREGEGSQNSVILSKRTF